MLKARLDTEPASHYKFRWIQQKYIMTIPKPIRILGVDDHFMVRMGLSSSLNVEPDIEVVAEAATGEAALEAYRKYHPSLVMMDLRLPAMTGIECTAALIREFPDACILILSTHSGEED